MGNVATPPGNEVESCQRIEKFGSIPLRYSRFSLRRSWLNSLPQRSSLVAKFKGTSLSAGGAVFKGIPFAAPPVGDLRWREPNPVKPWIGIRDATAFGSRCMQSGKNVSEDCLYLNVWTPEWPAKSRRPVMLWIHGGGNFAGSSGEAIFDGAQFAQHGVVLVSANYRLGVFGFFAHPELTAESTHHASGNYGLMDQIAALKWVHENIAKFGGDPRNVTLFGESAGALDINVLMTSPLTKGLFARLIGESGPVVAPPSLAEGEKKGLSVAEGLHARFAEGAARPSRRRSSEDDRTGIVVSRTTVGRSGRRLGTAQGAFCSI